MKCFSLNCDQGTTCRYLSDQSMVFHHYRIQEKIKDLVAMYKNISKKLCINLTDIFDETQTRSVWGRLKHRVSDAKTRVRSDFLTYRTLSDFEQLLGKYFQTLGRLIWQASKTSDTVKALWICIDAVFRHYRICESNYVSNTRTWLHYLGNYCTYQVTDSYLHASCPFDHDQHVITIHFLFLHTF